MIRGLYFDYKGHLLIKYYNLPKITNDCIDDPCYLKYNMEDLIAYEKEQLDIWEKTGKVENLPFLLEAVRELTKREEQ